MENGIRSRYELTPHAIQQALWRGIAEDEIWETLENPEQTIGLIAGRVVYQRRQLIEGKVYLLRVFVETNVEPQRVITVYRTSKVNKYWQR
jgi:hypothetical protein